MNRNIVILAVAALVLLYMVFVKGGSPKIAQKATSATPPKTSSSLVPTTKAILTFPLQNASDADKKAHFELVRNAAKDADVLDVSKCIPNPLVLNVKIGSTIKIKNDDSSDHKLTSMQKTIVIPAKTTTDVALDFFTNGRGEYAYGCDNSSGPAAGVFYATN